MFSRDCIKVGGGILLVVVEEFVVGTSAATNNGVLPPAVITVPLRIGETGILFPISVGVLAIKENRQRRTSAD